SGELTIKHLLAHTSGLPDYFEDKSAAGKSVFVDLIKGGNDRSWTFDEFVALSKALPTHFAPGTKKKAHYSDTNFQLLGNMIERLTGRSIGENYNHFIIDPLGLASTYLYTDVTDTRPKVLYYKKRKLVIPQAMASFGPDGGMVSTSTDMLVFLDAFFTGKLFPSIYLGMMQQWNNLFYPLQSGVG